jgi:hypothetical protein
MQALTSGIHPARIGGPGSIVSRNHGGETTGRCFDNIQKGLLCVCHGCFML